MDDHIGDLIREIVLTFSGTSDAENMVERYAPQFRAAMVARTDPHDGQQEPPC